MKINTTKPLSAASTVNERIAAMAALMRRQAQLEQEQRDIERWHAKLAFRKEQVESELAAIGLTMTRGW